VKYAFTGSASNVTIRGCVIQNYTSCNQCGAIWSRGDGWLITENEVRNNAFGGIDAGGNNTRVIHNNVHHNGQYGIAGGDGSNLLIENNDIAYNNTKHLDATFEAGGGKVTSITGVTWRNNRVHHNSGPGIWGDESVRNAVIEGNTVYDNGWAGIMFEISYDAVIRNNVVTNNGSCNVSGVMCDPRGAFWRVEILIFNFGLQSRQSVISGNTISGPNTLLLFLNQDRGAFSTWNWRAFSNGLTSSDWEFDCDTSDLSQSTCNAIGATINVTD
jgi:parallel beta-helix repeat protein